MADPETQEAYIWGTRVTGIRRDGGWEECLWHPDHSCVPEFTINKQQIIDALNQRDREEAEEMTLEQKEAKGG